MPAGYEKMKAKFIAERMSEQDAKRKAARIYNAKRKKGQKPVTRKKD